MNIFLDLDGVVCDFTGSLLRMVGKEELAHKIDFYHFENDNNSEVLTEDEFFQAWDKFTALQGFVGIKWMPGAYRGIKELIAMGYKVHFITDRRVQDRDQTRRWKVLNGFGDIPLIFSMGDKLRILKVRDVDVFVEDKVEIIKEAKELGINVVRFQQRWNRELKFSPTFREYIPFAKNWNDLVLWIKAQEVFNG